MITESNSFDLSKELYDKETILETSHLFTDKYFIDIADGVCWKISIRSKNASPFSFENTKGEFVNKLLDNQIRINLDKEFGLIRLEIVKKAFSPLNKENKSLQ
jgi:His-Xaa-Ser system protein HxsD